MTSPRHDVEITWRWMRDGEAFFATQLAALSDADLDEPSALPGWDRRMVVGHVARNAEALTRLLSWARTGIETPMYADATQRAREIEESARRPASELRADVQRTAATLDGAAARLSAGQWRTVVRSARGRRIPAAEVPWMRCREVWLHGLDLAAGAVAHEIPEAFAEVVVDDLVEFMDAQPGLPPTEVSSTGADGRTRRFGSAKDGEAKDGDPTADATGAEPVVQVRGDPRVLALWLSGRSYDPAAIAGDAPPKLPAWL